MFSSLFSTDLKIAFVMILIFLLALYVLSIIWVIRDAYSRGAKWKFWGLIALIPLAGLIAYVLLRPQLLLIDRDEQELEIAIKQRELLKYGECSKCGYPVQNDYLICPNCRQKLKFSCTSCGKPLDFKWKACPWCGAPKPLNPNPNFDLSGIGGTSSERTTAGFDKITTDEKKSSTNKSNTTTK